MTEGSARRFAAVWLALVLSVAGLQGLHAQGAQQGQQAAGRLLVTVVDPSGAVIPSATVTVIGQEPATSGTTIAPASTSPQGIATIASLPQGRYNIQAEFPGFDTNVLKDVRIRTGDNRHVVVLPLPRLAGAVTVGVDRQVVAADRARTFGSALTREQIDALSDDPDEMKRQLQEMAGSLDAIIRVDSFEGSELPPKAQIKSIHITRDAFAAENHNAGGLFIDIITQPGIGPIRVGMNMRLRNGRLSGQSPFTPTKAPEQIQNYGGNIGGTLQRERSSFSLNISGQHAYDMPIVNAALPNTNVSTVVPIKSPRENVFVNGLFDYALTRDQTLRVGVNTSRFTNGNLGIGAYDLPERAYSTSDSSVGIRVQEAGPLGRRFFTNTRLQIGVNDSSTRSAVEATTILVNDAFNSGGRQLAGGRHARSFNLASDLDYVRGIHSVRTGIQLDGGWYRSDDRQNYFGTYTFESLDAFDAGTPRSYTRRIGDPYIEYGMLQAGFYIQDDIRVRRNLTLSPGLRYEAMLHVSDASNFGPRFGVTWAPFRSGRTSLRASAGTFYDWMAANTYEQTLRIDGYRQQEFNIIDPPFNAATPLMLDADAGGPGGTVAPVNRYIFGNSLVLPTTRRLSAGIDQTINSRLRMGATYAYSRGSSVWRGNNLNAPVDGVRPDPGFANVVEVVSDGGNRQHSLSANFSVNLARAGGAGPVAIAGRDGPPPPPPPPGGASGARFDWRRLSINGNYSFGHIRNNVDGAFGVSPTGTIDTEWGPGPGDVRHRFNIGLNSSQLRNLSANLNMNMATATPYNIRTGLDDNGDLLFNDRPVGVGRNSERAAGQWTMNANVSYSIAFGKGTVSAPPGVIISIPGGGAVPTVTSVASPAAAARYRLGFNVSINNVTNHDNYGGYNGSMTSPFFGQATNVINPRKVDAGMFFNF